MSISITQESKNTLAITNESKSGATDTFADHPETFAEQSGTFGAPGTPITRESKNSLTITNENKN